MTRNKNAKRAARRYADAHSVPFAQAQRAEAARRTGPVSARPMAPARLPTQMTRLDALLKGGLPRGEVTALWAPTKVGTSMLGITLARMTALSGQHAVIVAAESPERLYAERVIAATTGVPTNELGLLRIRLTSLTRDKVLREGCRYAKEVSSGVQA